MLKHWENSHGGEGTPQFRFKIVKFCRTALQRQVGEATRIALRGNTLNSKAGYNRSGLTRLTLLPEDTTRKPAREMEDSSWIEGLTVMEQRAVEKAKMAEQKSRKRNGEEENTNRKSKKKRKLKHRVVEEDWGLNDGELEE